jgi:hypothetical protein
MKMKQGKLYEWNPSQSVPVWGRLDPSLPTHGEFVSSFGSIPTVGDPAFGEICVFENPDSTIFFVPLNMMADITEVE